MMVNFNCLRRVCDPKQNYTTHAERAIDVHHHREPSTRRKKNYYTSLMAAFTFATNSGGISLNPCAVRACSCNFFINSASVSARASKSQATPTSEHFMLFAMTASSG